MLWQTFVSECSSDDCVGLTDSVEMCVSCRVPVGVPLQVEAWQEVHGGDVVKESTVRVHGHDFTILQIFC